MRLKIFALSGTALILWLVPLTALDKKIGWHKSMQGISLGAAIICAVSAGNLARKLADENEIELIKERAITADIVDEIATSAYVSQSQRQQEAEQILNPTPNPNDAVLLLERALALSSGDSEPKISEPDLNSEEQELAEKIMNLKIRGYGKVKIIAELWGASKGGGTKYKAAEAVYRRLVGE